MDSTGSPADDGSGRDMFEVEMKRYVIDELSYKRRLIESPDGDWVRYEDAQAEIVNQQAQIERLEASNNTLQVLYKGAIEDIESHEAENEWQIDANNSLASRLTACQAEIEHLQALADERGRKI